MQVYKQLKILSARPDPKQFQKIRHHLYGFHDVKKNFSTGDWLKLVNKTIKNVKKYNYEGVFLQKNKCLILDKKKIIDYASQNNLFISSVDLN